MKDQKDMEQEVAALESLVHLYNTAYKEDLALAMKYSKSDKPAEENLAYFRCEASMSDMKTAKVKIATLRWVLGQ